MAKNTVLKPKDWVIFREYENPFFGKRSFAFAWRIGRIVSVDASGANVLFSAPEPPREAKKFDPEKEPWNIPGIVLPLLSPEYLICIHLRNRGSIVWLTEARPRHVKREDVVLANNVADVENMFSSKFGFS